MARSTVLSALTVALLLIPARTAGADGPTSGQRLLFGHTVGLQWSVDLPEAVVDEAIALWSECPDYGVEFPRFVKGGAAVRTLRIEYTPGEIGPGRCGYFNGRTVELYDVMLDDFGRVLHCGSLAQNLAHELGHALGLDDDPEGARRANIMSLISAANAYGRSVRVSECNAAGSVWVTPTEWRRSVNGEGAAASGATLAYVPQYWPDHDPLATRVDSSPW